MIKKTEKQFNMFPSHIGLRKYVQYYNVVFPENETYTSHYTLMPDACGTLSLAFKGNGIHAELWGASLSPVILGREPVQYGVLFLIQLTPIGLYQITGQSQTEFAGKRLLLEEIDQELFKALSQSFLSAKTIMELVRACEKVLYSRMEKHIVSDAVLLATTTIEDYHGQIPVREIAQQVCYSERQLIGYS